MPKILIRRLLVQLQLASPFIERKMTSFETYYKQIEQYPLLTIEEEINLSHIIRNSTDPIEKKKAIDKIVVSNLRLVIFCAKSIDFPKDHMSIMDLIQEGNKKLLKAARYYDYDNHKTKFSTYAFSVIKKNMMYASTRERLITLPPKHNYIIGKLIEIRNRMGYDNIDEITFKEFQSQDWISDKIKNHITIDTFRRIKSSFKSSVYLTDDWNKFIETKNDDDNIPQIEHAIISDKRTYLMKIIKDIASEREAYLIKRVFYDNLSFSEVGAEVGLTKQHVQQSLKRLFHKFRTQIVHDKKNFDEIPVKWIKVMEGKIKPLYQRSRISALGNRLDPVFLSE